VRLWRPAHIQAELGQATEQEVSTTAFVGCPRRRSLAGRGEKDNTMTDPATTAATRLVNNFDAEGNITGVFNIEEMAAIIRTAYANENHQDVPDWDSMSDELKRQYMETE
jgi:hypothetical protein